MNKTCFDSLCKVEAFGSLREMSEKEILNHRQLHEVIVGNYDLLKKGRYGMTKTAVKKLLKTQGTVPEFIPEKIREVLDNSDWLRSTKIAFGVELMSSADEDLVFPPPMMRKIESVGVPSVTTLSGKDKGVVWFCIQEIQEKTTKNNKTFYRMRVCNNNSESCWLRVWTKFKEVPELYTLWIAEVASSEAWGLSTSSYKMKQLRL